MKKMTKKQINEKLIMIAQPMFVMICSCPPEGFDVNTFQYHIAMKQFDEAYKCIMDFLNFKQKQKEV